MALDPREGLHEFTEFRGLRNTVDARDFGPGDLTVATNVDIDDARRLARRKGFSTVVVAGVDRDLFANGTTCLAVGSNVLKQILPDYSTITLRSGLTASRPLQYCPVADRVYYSNGVEHGTVQNGAHRTWGITPPVLGAAQVTGGGLRSGRYQYSMTYIRDDGQESGAALAQVVTLSATGGFTLTLPVSADAAVVEKCVYLSTTDGETLFLYGVYDNAVTSLDVLSPHDGVVPLETQFLVPPSMLGTISNIAYGNGRMLVAVGNRLYPSEPYAPELFDPRKALPFPDRITMVAPLKGGTWLGTESLVAWLQDAEPENWDYEQRADYGVIPGTSTIASAEGIGEGESKLLAVFFASKSGLCAGLANGQLLNFTDDTFSYPIQPIGAGVVRDYRGSVQYLVTLNGPETAGNTHS